MDMKPGAIDRVAVEARDGKRELRTMYWGLKRRTLAGPDAPPIHARAETLLERPMFRDLVLSGRRCILPMKQWFEGKTEIRVEMDGEAIFGVAGIYDAWPLPDGKTMESFCIVTVDAAPAIQHLNNRMPAILRPEDDDAWLSRNERDLTRILSLLRPFDGRLIIGNKWSPSTGAVTQQALDLGPAGQRRSDD